MMNYVLNFDNGKTLEFVPSSFTKFIQAFTQVPSSGICPIVPSSRRDGTDGTKTRIGIGSPARCWC